MRLQSSLVFVTLVLAACADSPTTPSASPVEPRATFATSAAPVIPGRFIVTLRDGVSPAAVAREHGVAPDFVYTSALNGFAGEIADAAREGLMRDARVVALEPDGVMEASTTQTGATWGLDRIDQRDRPLNGTYIFGNTGSGVTAYIIDTGIRTSHNEFGGRASEGFTAINDGRGSTDCNGHGTHVAGTVGGSTYGVAKSVNLVAVRVLGCSGSGSTSGVIAGIEYVTANHQTGAPAVANMSLGGSASTALDNAVKNSIADGVTYAIAAGNGNIVGIAQDACKYSPARVAEAITVGATDRNDKKASWSNFGNCVDFFAPGVSITSAWYTSTTATNTISGTSMATPHVAGVAALYLQGNPTAAPPAVRDALYANTTKGAVTSSKTANNHLLFSDY